MVTDAQGNTAETDHVSLTIAHPDGVTIVTQPKDVTGAAPDGRVSFSVKAWGEGLTYQWYYRTPAGNTYPSVCRKATYAFTARGAYDGREIWCVVSDAAGNEVESDHVTLTLAE